MNKSESIKELMAALSKVQGEIQNVRPNQKSHNNEYADLGAMLKAARPLLAKNQLAMSQLVSSTKETPDIIEVETILGHASGEWLSSVMCVRAANTGGKMNPVQSAGSVITYLKRYMLGGLIGFTKDDDDDDANFYQQPHEQQQYQEPPQQQQYSQQDSPPYVYYDPVMIAFKSNDQSKGVQAWGKLTRDQQIEVWKVIPQEQRDWINQAKAAYASV